MKTTKLSIALGLALAAGAAQAAGPLYLWDGGAEPTPYKWDTSNGPIPVYTDGGGAFTWADEAETEVFISIERANEITQFAFGQWNAVPTSTFEAQVTGTIEDQIGIADITADNAEQVYGAENGYGFWVVYDTDGYILENLFGVPRSAVLGIAFPEWADEETGEIVEATALMNGWNVWVNDNEGNQVAGVFTHEFGHAINLSHTQVNGHMAYQSYTYAPEYPGVEGCVDPVYRWDYPVFVNPRTDPAQIETMFPFIDHSGQAGVEMSTVNMPDDIAAISTLYPTPDFADSTGTITGVLSLKDGKTPYMGVNVIARNVNDPMGDAVSNMTGAATQGEIGPDGRFTITGLTPGEEYVVYIEQVNSGGYPTGRSRLLSQAEYWNEGESNDPATDTPCDATPILAEAGVTKTADITFNGYLKGIQYTPIVAAFLTDLSKNGKKSAGTAGSTAFVWDENRDFIVLGGGVVANNGQMTRNGDKMTVQFDYDGNGIQQASLFDFRGKKKGGLISNGDLNGDTCGGSSSNGVNSSSGWAVDDDGHTVVGLSYVDVDGNGSCQAQRSGEILPFIWDAKHGHRELDTSNVTWGFKYPFLRAHAISGNGRVVLGGAGTSRAVAWVDEGPMIDLRDAFDGREAYAVNRDGTRVAMSTGGSDGVVLWNPMEDQTDAIGSLRWCEDMDFNHFRFGNLCEPNMFCPNGCSHEELLDLAGAIPLLPTDMNDEGTVIIGRAGSFFTGFMGAMWVEDMGWIGLADFFYKQGVAEAFDLPMDNPISLSGSGSKMVGGLAGASFSWHVEMQHVYVCEDGESVQVGFPNGLREAVAEGAEFGRCEFLY